MAATDTLTAPPPKPSRASLIFRNSFWNGLDTVLVIIVGILSTMLVGRQLGPELIGTAALLNYFANLVPALAISGLNESLLKYLSQYLEVGKKAMARRVLRLVFLLNTIAVTLFIACALAITYYAMQPKDRLWSMLSILALFPGLMQAPLTITHNSLQDYQLNVVPSITSLMVQFLGTLLALHMGWGLVGISSALLLARTLDFLGRAILYWRIARPRMASAPGALESTESADEMRAIRWPFFQFLLQAAGLQAINLVVWDRSEMFFLGTWFPDSQVTYYSLAFMLTGYLLTLPEMLVTPASQNMIGRIAEDRVAAGRMTATIIRYSLLLGVPCFWGVFCLAEPLIRLAYGRIDYLPAIVVVQVATMLGIARCPIKPLRLVIAGNDRQKHLIRIMIGAGVANILLDILLIRSFQSIGAAWANGLAQAIAVVWMWFFASRYLHVPIHLMSLLRILFAGLGMADVVLAIALFTPSWLAMLLGVPAGAVTYAILIRFFRCVGPSDGERLSALEARLPGRLKPVFQRILRFVISPETEKPELSPAS